MNTFKNKAIEYVKKGEIAFNEKGYYYVSFSDKSYLIFSFEIINNVLWNKSTKVYKFKYSSPLPSEHIIFETLSSEEAVSFLEKLFIKFGE